MCDFVSHHRSMVTQPFADFTWRHARKIAAERGLDDTNETAVAAVLGALLRRGGNGPETSRVLARQKAMAALPPPLPEEALPPALPAPAALPAARSGDGEPGEDGRQRSRGPWWASGCSTRSAGTGGTAGERRLSQQPAGDEGGVERVRVRRVAA
jgi:hypothetical protein